MVNYHTHIGTLHLVADAAVIVHMGMVAITAIVDATSVGTLASEEM